MAIVLVIVPSSRRATPASRKMQLKNLRTRSAPSGATSWIVAIF
jgi:hypothetical protein